MSDVWLEPIPLSVHSRSFSGLHKAHAKVTHLLLCVNNLYLPAGTTPYSPQTATLFHTTWSPALWPMLGHASSLLFTGDWNDTSSNTFRDHQEGPCLCLHTTLSSDSYCFLQRLTLLVGSLYLRQPSYKRKRFVLTQFWRLRSIISGTHCFQS